MSFEKEIFDEKKDEKCNDKGVHEEMVEKEMSTEGGIFLTEKKVKIILISTLEKKEILKKLMKMINMDKKIIKLKKKLKEVPTRPNNRYQIISSLYSFLNLKAFIR